MYQKILEAEGRNDMTTEHVEIDNPCYHCYAGAIGECQMIGCKYNLKSWSHGLENKTIEITELSAK